MRWRRVGQPGRRPAVPAATEGADLGRQVAAARAGRRQSPATSIRDSYDAFVSYSRGVDEKVACALQQGLQRFTKPWYRARALRVFRDDSSLSANPGLWSSIQAALDGSDFLVLVASVDAASSEWVRREVVHWLEQHDAAHLLIALTDGEIVWDAAVGDFDPDATTALPPALLGRFREEPRYVDLRWARRHGELSPSLPQVTEAVANLASPMHGRPKDELIGEDVRQHRRTVRLARTAIAALAALVLLAGAAAVVAVDQRDDARRQRDRAEFQERVAVSRQLAAQALVDLPEQPDRALLLSLESLKAHAGPHGLDALLTSLQRVWTARAYLDNDAPVLSLAYSPDGTTLATGHNDRTIRLWDVASGRPRGDPLPNHQLLVTSLAFSPSGDLLAAVDRDGGVVVHDLATPALPGRSFGTSVLAVAFRPDGARLATGSGGDVQVWDVATGQPIGPPITAAASRIHQLAWSPDGGVLGVVTTDGHLSLRDAATGQVVATPLAGTDTAVRSLAFSPDGTSVALGLLDGSIVLWDRPGGRARGAPLSGHTAAVLSLAFNAEGTFLASGSADETVIAWDLATGKPGPPYRGHGEAVRAVAFRPDSQEIASGGFDGSLVLWQAESRLVTPITSNEQDLRSVAYSADLARLVFGYGNGNLYVWDLPGTAPSGGPMRLDGHVPTTLAVSPDGTLAASGDGQGTFVLWDLRERRAIGEPLRSPATVADLYFLYSLLVTGQGPGAFPTTFEKLRFSPDGSRLATVSFDNQIVLWDAGSGRPVGAPLAGNAGPVASLAFSPDGRLLASGDLTGQVVVWDVATAQQRGAPLAGPTLLVESLAFAPNGATLATGLADGTILLWDVEARRPIGEPLRGHSSSVVDLAFEPNAAMLASGGSDGSVLLWDAATGQLLGEPVTWHKTPVQALAFAPDGTRMATGSSDGTAYWDVDATSWAAAACAIANRNLTQVEWTQLFGSRPYEPTCAQS